VVDLTFPGQVLRELEPDLTKLNFTITEKVIVGRVIRDLETTMTVLIGDSNQRIYLIFLKQSFINVDHPNVADFAAMALLKYRLPEEGSLVIVAENVDALGISLDKMIEAWRNDGMRVRFLPWRQIEDVRQSQNERSRRDKLSDILMDSQPAMPTDGLSEIEHADEQSIVAIMGRYASASAGNPEQFFEDLIRGSAFSAGTRSEALSKIEGTGRTSEARATKLVQWASTVGRFTPRGQTARSTVLGEIMKELAKKCGDDDREKLYRIAERYQLLGGPDLQRLKGI
jgi:hypothetical protein